MSDPLTIECPTCARPTHRGCVTSSGHGRIPHPARKQAVGLSTGWPTHRVACPDCGKTFAHPNALARHSAFESRGLGVGYGDCPGPPRASDRLTLLRTDHAG